MKRIMVVKLGGIGDVILATSAVSELKRIYPGAKITLMIYGNAAPLIEGIGFIDEVFVYDKKKVGGFSLFRKMLGYDMAVFLDMSYRPALAAALARVPVRVGLEHKRGFWLTRSLPWQEYMDHTYEPYVFGDILRKALEIDFPRKNLERLFVAAATTEEKNELNRLLEENNVDTQNEKYLVCSPYTAFHLKDWPLVRWNELFTCIYDAYGYRTVIFGATKSDFSWNTAAICDLSTKLTLRQVAELIKNAALLVNSCSMPEHIAAATQTPCVVLYGYTDAERWAPRLNCLRVTSDLPCSPCDGYRGSTCSEAKCMMQISVSQVFEICKKMLGT